MNILNYNTSPCSNEKLNIKSVYASEKCLKVFCFK